MEEGRVAANAVELESLRRQFERRNNQDHMLSMIDSVTSEDTKNTMKGFMFTQSFKREEAAEELYHKTQATVKGPAA